MQEKSESQGTKHLFEAITAENSKTGKENQYLDSRNKKKLQLECTQRILLGDTLKSNHHKSKKKREF